MEGPEVGGSGPPHLTVTGGTDTRVWLHGTSADGHDKCESNTTDVWR